MLTTALLAEEVLTTALLAEEVLATLTRGVTFIAEPA